MTVAITWSTTDSGSAISDPLDHGSDAAGATLVEQEIFLRHDGINPITDAGFYVAEKSGVYSGAASAALDLAELLAWGFGITVTAFGGILLNMDATGGYTGLWSTFSVKFVLVLVILLPIKSYCPWGWGLLKMGWFRLVAHQTLGSK